MKTAFRSKSFVALIVLLIIALAVFVSQKTVFKPKQTQKIQTAKVERGTIMSSVLVSGQIAATARMPVVTKATGQVKEVFVKDADPVVAGQKLLELIPDAQSQQAISSAWATYLSAKNTLAAATAALYSLQSTMFSKWKTYYDIATNSTYQSADGTPNTTNRILTPFTIAQDDWLAAEAAYKNQQGVITQAQAGLTNAWNSYQLLSPTVTAPMAGTVTDLTYVPGMMMISENIASIVGDSVPAATFSLSEADVVYVKSGQAATMTLDAFPGKTYTGVVAGVNRGGVTVSGVTTYPATVQMDTAPEGLVPNMSVSATIITATHDNVLLVPSAAIRQQGDQPTVRRQVRGKVEDVPVETGLTSDTQTEIISGLEEGDTVIIGQTGTSNTNTSSPFGVRLGGFGGGTVRTGR